MWFGLSRIWGEWRFALVIVKPDTVIERETLNYERYLLQLVTRECEDRQLKRIERLLNQSRILAEKALSPLA